jgi:hypothetical protein
VKGFPGVVKIGVHSPSQQKRLGLSEEGENLCERLFGGVPEHGQWYANEKGELCLRPVNLRHLRRQKYSKRSQS